MAIDTDRAWAAGFFDGEGGEAKRAQAEAAIKTYISL
jgi:hypothetical protein